MAVDVFVGEDEMFDRLFVVTDDAAFVSNPDKLKLSAIAAQIRAGAPVKSIVPDAEEVPYTAITSLKANKLRDDLNLHYRQGSQTRMKNVTFKDAPARDLALAALERRLAPRFQRREVQYGLLRAAFAPLLTTAGLTTFTYVAVQAAAGLAAGDDVEIRGRARAQKRMFAWVLEFLGPAGVGMVGALLILGCIAWLVARVKHPPLMVLLSPRK